jgi:ankyrin repeat protein
VPNRPPADGFHPKDLELIIKDAVRANEIDYVRILLARTDQNLLRYLLNIAAAEASPDMLELLLEKVSNAPLWKLLLEAIGSQNLATVNYLITRGVDVARDEELMKRALETCNPEVIDILLNHGAQLVEHDEMLTESLITWRRMTLKEEDEEKLLKRLYQVKKYVIGVSAYGEALLNASASLTSIPLIEYFLENGADIDYKNQRGYITLHEVIKAGSNRHAEVAKFLLQRGANPYPSKPKSGVNISKLAGMRRVEEYFRMSWDELVKEVQSERALNAD